eukprot:Opistho-2@44285
MGSTIRSLEREYVQWREGWMHASIGARFPLQLPVTEIICSGVTTRTGGEGSPKSAGGIRVVLSMQCGSEKFTLRLSPGYPSASPIDVVQEMSKDDPTDQQASAANTWMIAIGEHTRLCTLLDELQCMFDVQHIDTLTRRSTEVFDATELPVLSTKDRDFIRAERQRAASARRAHDHEHAGSRARDSDDKAGGKRKRRRIDSGVALSPEDDETDSSCSSGDSHSDVGSAGNRTHSVGGTASVGTMSIACQEELLRSSPSWRLLRDFVEISSRVGQLGYQIEIVGGDIYRWMVRYDVRISNAHRRSPRLGSDVGGVSVELVFAPEAWPGFPPIARLVCPILPPPVYSEVTLFSALRPSVWDAHMKARSSLTPSGQVQPFGIAGTSAALLAHHLVEIGKAVSKCCDISTPIAAAYPRAHIEQTLANLAVTYGAEQLLRACATTAGIHAAFECCPMGQQQSTAAAMDVDTPDMALTGVPVATRTFTSGASASDLEVGGGSGVSAPTSGASEKQSMTSTEYWSRGVGYGHNKRPAWDVTAYKTAQKERNATMGSLLCTLLSQMRSAGDGKGDQKGDASSSAEPMEEVFAACERSAFLPIAESLLSQDNSLLEMQRHSGLYVALFDCLSFVAAHSVLGRLLVLPINENVVGGQSNEMASAPLAGVKGGKTVASLVHTHGALARQLIKRIAVAAPAQEDQPQIVPQTVVTDDGGASCVQDNEETFARALVALDEKVAIAVLRYTSSALLSGNVATHRASEAPTEMHVCCDLTAVKLPTARDYIHTMSSLLFQTGSIPLVGSHRHQFSKLVLPPPSTDTQAGAGAASTNPTATHHGLKAQGGSPSGGNAANSPSAAVNPNNKPKEAFSARRRILRIAQELDTLSTSLPLEATSAILVRTDETKMDLLQALIIGPEGTPYSGGCFLFDVYFPKDYPTVPPQVQLQTTGGGSVRFNPNLYANGKVCLSLLNTWEGQPGEKWAAETSTLLQVLVSIQSLIFVPSPWFNEPGYEKYLGTPEGDKNSSIYNQNLRVRTVQLAMLGILQSPPPCFDAAVKSHFFLRKEAVLAQCREWLADAAAVEQSVAGGKGNHRQELEKAVGELESLLGKLGDPRSTVIPA